MTTRPVPYAQGYYRSLFQLAGLNQKSAAQKLGLSVQFINDIWNGRRLVSVRVADLIADKLDLSPQGRTELHRIAAMSHGWRI